MNTAALIFMTISFLIVSFVTGYFFYKALTTPDKSEE